MTLQLALSRIVTSVSVRTRIIAIALIPVAGLFVTGFAFAVGEAEVETAFNNTQRASELTEASGDYQRALANMRIVARDFASHPTDEQISSFEQSTALALARLNQIEKSLQISGGNKVNAARVLHNVDSLRVRLTDVGSNFAGIIDEQRRLGFTENEGIRRRLRESSTIVERVINEDLSWANEADAAKLAMSLLVMRRYEADYQVTRMQFVQQLFFDEFKKFQTIFSRIDGSQSAKDGLSEKVKDYANTFEEWIKSIDKVRPFLTVIDVDTQQMMPMADDLIAFAREQASKSDAVLNKSQARTRNILLAVGFGVVFIGLACSWLIGRSITRPLNGLASVMKQLAAGDTSARIPATRAKDEIGDMARTVIVFRDNMIERERLAASQAETGQARERRSELIAGTIAQFEKSVDAVLSKVRGAADRLESASGQLNSAADSMSAEARQAENRITVASENVTAAAGSVEELAASIGDIASQAHKSTDVAGRAVAEARRTTQTMEELAAAATRIGEVISLIQAIAGQTNLLALNATIEAARAGDAGRGFAVVASEVKSLAGQTAKATEDIAEQIGSIQSAAADAARAITQVNAIIEDMSAIASGVAVTVEEQNSAVSSIAQGVSTASGEARTGAEAMSRVAVATNDARSTAADVKALADTLAVEAEGLEAEVRRFLSKVQAA